MLISIITINYNNLEGLKRTVKSVLSQTSHQIEYLIIDGDSTDGSKAFIEECQDKLAYWVSEPDHGVYDAMNKGIDHASGDYLLFLNSGDWLFDDLVIEEFIRLKPIEDIVYGTTLMLDGSKWKKLKMPRKMSVAIALTHTLAHQAEFYKKSLFVDGFRYDTSYQVVSDWILTCNAIVFKNCSTRYIDMVVCYFDDPGISSDLKKRVAERKRYLKENFDPLFLKLLKDYRQLHKKHTVLSNNPMVRFAVFAKGIKNQFMNTFKHQS